MNTYIWLYTHLATRHGHSLGTDLRYRLARTPSTIHFNIVCRFYIILTIVLSMYDSCSTRYRPHFASQSWATLLLPLRVSGIFCGLRGAYPDTTSKTSLGGKGLYLDGQQIDNGRAIKIMPEKFASED